MAQRFNLFDPNLLPQNFLGGIAGNPSELIPPPVIGGVAGNPSEDVPDPYSGYVPLPPVILGGVDGSDPVRSGVPQNIADFYGGILNIGQPDAGYFDEFRLPGDDRVIESGTNLTVATPTDVVDTRVPYDPDYYKELAQALGGDRGGYDDTAVINELAALRELYENSLSNTTPTDQTNNQVVVDNADDPYTPPNNNLYDPPGSDVYVPPVYDDPYTPPVNDVFVPPVDGGNEVYVQNNDNYIIDQLTKLQDQQQGFAPAEPAFIPAYDDIVLRQQMSDSQNQLTNLPPADNSQLFTAAEIPSYQQFDPVVSQQQISSFRPTARMQTSPVLTGADLPALEEEIAELRAQLNRNTTPTPALTTPTFSGILPDFGGFNVR